MQNVDTKQLEVQAERVSIARSRLFQQAPWFGAMSLNLKVSPNNPTKALMATDGTTLYYTPARVAETSDAELIGVWAHEVMHCALLHPFREGTREHHMWNEACDYAINSIVLKQFKLPSYALYNPEYENLSAEQIYAVLAAIKQKEDEQKQEQEDSLHPEDDTEDDATDTSDSDSDSADDTADDGSPGNTEDTDNTTDEDTNSASEDTAPAEYDNDDVIPAPKGGKSGTPTDSQDESGEPSNNEAPNADTPMTELDWQIAAEQAEMVAQKAGVMSGDVSRVISDTRQPKADPWAILRQFVESRANTDYSWARPSKRMLVTAGLYMPGIVSDEMPPIAVAVDTSGSVTPQLLSRFGAELTTILNEYKPRELHVIYCDSKVRGVQTFYPGDAVKLDAKGGGGTAFGPVFDYIKSNGQSLSTLTVEQDTVYDEISCLIYLTDLYGDDNNRIIEPEYPVLWAAPAASRMRPPWGEYVELDIA